MDVEAENIIKLIFHNELPDKWKENPDFYHYLSKLGGYSVEQLTKEPDRLGEEKAAVLSQTQELAFANYKTFIQTAECSREIFHEFKKTEDSLDSLLEGLPVLSAACEEFAQASSEIKTHRHLNSLTLVRNAQLLQILEMPQLMDSCIRDGHFEEALQLASYVRRFGNKHSDIKVIANIVKEVEVSWWSLMHQLIAQLRSDLQLPRCLQVVGYLRRMEVFTEPELRLKFLQARDAWFQSLLLAIPNDDANQHLMKTIELSRVHLFNIITQYRAVFSDDDAVITSKNMKQQSLCDSTIFHCWIIEKVHQFIGVLEVDLARGVGSSLPSLLGQSMYFGLSFSRVGADFRALIASVFVKTVVHNFTSSLKKATKKFDSDMEKFTLPRTVVSAHSLQAREQKSQELKDHQPPEVLLEFYPLADYCNNILTALNDLRLCAPFAAAHNVTAELQDSLLSVSNSILLFYRQEQQALIPSEKESFTRFCTYFADYLISYLQRCLHAIYKPADIAKYLGVTTFNLQEQKLTYLNQTEILDPINHLLPVKVSGIGIINPSPTDDDNILQSNSAEGAKPAGT